jgi:hypothetical protein
VRGSLMAWLARRGRTVCDYVFPSRIAHGRPMRLALLVEHPSMLMPRLSQWTRPRWCWCCLRALPPKRVRPF